MIDTKTEELASLYVLDLLKGDELSAFEKRMEQEADVMELVRQLSTALHSPMKQFNGPERMDLLEGIHERIGIAPGGSISRQKQEAGAARPKAVPISWVQALSAAAALLLVLNLFQYFDTGKDLSSMEQELSRSQLAEQALLAENETIKTFNKSWENEYMNLAQRMLPFVASRDGVGQFTVIDLVDVRASAGRVDSRKNGDISEYLLSRSPLKFASLKMLDIAENNESVTVGYTVWKEDESRGYLDLYNLGDAAPGKAPFLWVRDSGDASYLPVGYVPSLEGGTGTFTFTVNRDAFKPASILITEESLNGPGDQPSAHYLMVGP